MPRANIHRMDMKKVMCPWRGLLRKPALRGSIHVKEVGKKEVTPRF